MLDGIVNIKTDRDYANRNSVSRYQRFLDRAYENDYFGKDSIIFSPAAVYLSKLHWHLKEINFISDDKFHFDFFINDVEFITEIDLLNFYSEPEQKYKLVRQIELDENPLKIFIEIEVKKELKLDDIKTVRMEPAKINQLFNRVYDMKINSQINRFDKLVNHNIASDITEEIYEELDFVNNAIYNFLTKLEKFTFKKYYKFDYKKPSPITIQRILTFNAK